MVFLDKLVKLLRIYLLLSDSFLSDRLSFALHLSLLLSPSFFFICLSLFLTPSLSLRIYPSLCFLQFSPYFSSSISFLSIFHSLFLSIFLFLLSSLFISGHRHFFSDFSLLLRISYIFTFCQTFPHTITFSCSLLLPLFMSEHLPFLSSKIFSFSQNFSIRLFLSLSHPLLFSFPLCRSLGTSPIFLPDILLFSDFLTLSLSFIVTLSLSFSLILSHNLSLFLPFFSFPQIFSIFFSDHHSLILFLLHSLSL